MVNRTDHGLMREIGLCPIADFDINGSEPFSSTTRYFEFVGTSHKAVLP
jgi:hypothetical protein